MGFQKKRVITTTSGCTLQNRLISTEETSKCGTSRPRTLPRTFSSEQLAPPPPSPSKVAETLIFTKLPQLYAACREADLTTLSDATSLRQKLGVFISELSRIVFSLNVSEIPDLWFKFFVDSGLNELLLRLQHCLVRMVENFKAQYSSVSSSSSSSASSGSASSKCWLPFSCLVSRPRQHEFYSFEIPGSQGSFTGGSGAEEASADPVGAFYTNLSWLYYEMCGTPRPLN